MFKRSTRCAGGAPPVSLQYLQYLLLQFGQVEFPAEILAEGLGAVHRPRSQVLAGDNASM